MLTIATINRALNSCISCISYRNVKLKIIFLLGCFAYSIFITNASAEPAANTPSAQSNHPQSIAMAMLNTLPSKPTVLGSVKEIKSSNISSDYGNRIGPFTGLHENHDGLDIPAELGSPILAAGKGTVLYAAYAPGYGNLVEIDHGQGIITRYGHAKSYSSRPVKSFNNHNKLLLLVIPVILLGLTSILR
jgi:murein DD-endopeptidase MepM/ murein hydrolase activator NlpD